MEDFTEEELAEYVASESWMPWHMRVTQWFSNIYWSYRIWKDHR